MRKDLKLELENSAWYVTLIWTGDWHVREAWHVPEADWARDWRHYWGGERHSLFYEDDEIVQWGKNRTPLSILTKME